MGIETEEQKEIRDGVEVEWREPSRQKYREWAIRNAGEISDEALISLFGSGASAIRTAYCELLANPDRDIGELANEVGIVSKGRDRREYQRELMRKRRAEGKA